MRTLPRLLTIVILSEIPAVTTSAATTSAATTNAATTNAATTNAATTNAATTNAADVQPLLKTLQAVGPEGAGHREAARAWGQLAQADAADLPTILAGLDQAGPLAANWIRTAIDAIAERELRSGGRLPAAQLEAFVLDTRHAPRARRLAYEWLARVDRTAPTRLIPRMLNDPSLELRRDAVESWIEKATALEESGKNDRALAVYQEAFASARDLDQVKLLAGRIEKLGGSVDLPRHFGFLVRWKLIAPFDNTGEKGHDTVYPPEKEIDLAASYPGKHGPVRWIDHQTDDDYGTIDFNEAFREEKAVAGYATTEFFSERRQEVQFRLTTRNAVKLWLNGTLIDEHIIYHAGSELDQYISTAVLKPGRNVILVKICQNEQTQSWANTWQFQLRVCLPDGTAVVSQVSRHVKEKTR